jgi:CheY-like chemotaxis protein
VTSDGDGALTKRNGTLLLVEPHEDTRTLYATYLSGEGCQVDQAEDGREALVKALTQQPDAIVMETRLPEIDGFELCRLLRHDSATLQTPILIVTADAHAAERNALHAGADAVLLKPCLPERVLAEVRRLTALRRSAASAPHVEAAVLADGGGAKHVILSRTYSRGTTTAPPAAPPELRCPLCDGPLVYERSFIGGVSVRHPEQWDYFACQSGCGKFEYRQRTRKLRTVQES